MENFKNEIIDAYYSDTELWEEKSDKWARNLETIAWFVWAGGILYLVLINT